MKQLDWKRGPGYKRIEYIKLPEYETVYLDNGLKCILLDQGTQEIFKLDLVFRGGRLLEQKKITSKMTSQLMREGTSQRTSPEIAETIDFYGASLRMAANLDYSFVSLSGLSKHFASLLPIMTDVLYNPIFPESELNKAQKSMIQKLQMDLSKNELLNYRIFTEAIFGKDQVYGYNTEQSYVEALQREDLVRYHQVAYGIDHCFALIGGRLRPDTLELVNQYIGQSKKSSAALTYNDKVELRKGERIYVDSKNEHQASIRIGRKMFNKHHADFALFFVLNTVLGGYFGSRLMASIREDLGLTYNIYSVLDNMIYDGYFYIETDVALENIEKTIDEIYQQMEILKNELIKAEELTMVKNYLLGNFLNLVDGPINTLSFLRSLELDNTGKADFDQLVEEIKSCTAEDLLQMAQKYFNKEDMIEVIVRKQ